MLVTNSEERATIQQIYADKWFRTDLPEYLIPSEIAQLATSEGAENPLEIDPIIVTKVADVSTASRRTANMKSLNCTVEDVLTALAEPRETSAKKAYYLIAETEAIHHSTEKAQERGLTRNDSFLSSSPPPWNHSEQKPRTTAPRIPPMSALGNLQMTPADTYDSRAAHIISSRRRRCKCQSRKGQQTFENQPVDFELSARARENVSSTKRSQRRRP
jgi:carbon catabolite-derepressing protein kinase